MMINIVAAKEFTVILIQQATKLSSIIHYSKIYCQI
uniref:Uncharacterized protein n=1 Tax=Rhizophora mucronata TaxID=61149 RepID=A0A2P2QCA9_RHIMU